MTTTMMMMMMIPSTRPESDAELLVSLFPDLQVEREEHDHGDSGGVGNNIVLCDKQRGRFLFVVSSSSNAKNLVTLVMDDPVELAAVIQNCSKQIGQEISITFDRYLDDQVLQISLFGGCNLLCVAATVLPSNEGRMQLVKILQLLETNDARSSHETNGSTTTLSTLNQSAETDQLPVFPFLQVQVGRPQQQQQLDDTETATYTANFPLNSKVPVPIESDLFVGHMLMIVRPLQPEVDDPYWNERIFSKRKRRMIIQIQGKFKRRPNGVVYAGGEVSDPMKLGLLSRGLCSILLNLIDRMNANMHYSFGDDEHKEEAHIVVPAYTFFERLVATPPGETPPLLGDDFTEPEESLLQRRKSKSTGDWNTSDTYSMSFYSMYVDLPRWKIVNVPVTKDIDLKTFWGNSFLRIVLYEMNTPPGDSRHLRDYNDYALVIQVKFNRQHETQTTTNSQDEVEEEILPWNMTKPLVNRQPSNGLLRESSVGSYQDAFENTDSNEDEFFFFDAEEDLLEEETTNLAKSNVFRSSTSPMDLLSRIDQLCPAWIEVWTSKCGYTPVYAFNVQNSSRMVLRSYQLCTDCFDREDSRRVVEDQFSHRLSWNERNRRIFGHAFAKALEEDTKRLSIKLDRFQRASSEYDDVFLKRKEPVAYLSDVKEKSRIHKSAFVARAISDRHWVEEWTKIADGNISFYPPERGKARYRVSLSSIVRAERLDANLCPYFPKYHFMAIETVGRRIYLMFASESERDEWVIFLCKELSASSDDASSIQSKNSSNSDQLLKVDDPSEEFLHKSSMWDCKQRRILNCRQFSFHKQQVDALALGKEALSRALAREDSNVAALGEFLDCAAKLKNVNANKLNDNERLAFFLNLYHTLLIHAFLVLGPPDNGFKWISYFNTISYQCSDDIFSLAELEHCIIRAAMSYPTQFISRFVIPKSKYSFGLAKPDYRINFALNCGSVSNPAAVPIFDADDMDQQLEVVSRFFLDQQVTIKQRSAREIVIYLPRVCQWFSGDFGGGSNDDILRRIEHYLSEDKRRLLATCWIERGKRVNFGDLSVKFLPYSFECRFLGLAELQWN